jgi:carbon starvation protein
VRYAPVTLVPMLFVTATTMTAGVIMVQDFWHQIWDPKTMWKGILNLSLTLFVVVSVLTLLVMAVRRWAAVFGGMVPLHDERLFADRKV